jgi:hypothetical protein
MIQKITHVRGAAAQAVSRSLGQLVLPAGQNIQLTT